MFGYLKNVVYANCLHTGEELQDSIVNAVNSITTQQLEAVFNNMKKRVNLCLEMNGKHFQHLLAKFCFKLNMHYEDVLKNS